MATLTSTYSRLYNAQISLEKRIVLCRNVLESNDRYLPNRNQVLADWLCQELQRIHNFKGKKDAETSFEFCKLELWRLLHKVLGSRMSEHVVVRQSFLPILFGELSILYGAVENDDNFNQTAENSLLAVFLCCKDMLQNPNMSLYLFNKSDRLEQCVKDILSSFLVVLLKRNLMKPGCFLEEFCQLVSVVLERYAAVQRQQVAQRKVFANFCEKFLQLLLLVRTVVNDGGNHLSKFGLQNQKSVITSKIDTVIIAGLFHKDHMVNYKMITDNLKAEEPVTKKPKLLSYLSNLFEVLRCSAEDVNLDRKIKKQISTDLWRRSVRSNLSFLLKSFLVVVEEVEKVNRATKFNFFTELYSIIGLGKGTTTDQATLKVEKIAVLNEMLQVLKDYDMYHIAEDNFDGQIMFKWFVNLTDCLMLAPQECEVVLFKSLDILLQLNHKILEHFLDRIMERCLIQAQQRLDEVESMKIKVCCKLVDIYSKLQQVEHLVKCIVKAAKKLGVRLGVIPYSFTTKLAEAFEHCPVNLTLSVYQLLLDEMKDQVVSLEQCSSEEKYSGKDFNGPAVEGITILFVTFLCNTSYNASDPHGLDTKKANCLQQLIQDMQEYLVTPMIEAFPVCKKSCQKSIGFAVLYLLYGLNQVKEYLSHHDVIPQSDMDAIKLFWNSKHGMFLPHQSWNNMDDVTKCDRLRFCLEVLVVQRTRSLLAGVTPDKKELNFLVKFLFTFKDFNSKPNLTSLSWNGDPCCVTCINYPVAHWALVSNYATLLLPYCDDEQVHEFAKNFLKTLSFCDTGSLPDHALTVSQVSGRLLVTGELLDLPSLQAVVVHEFWELVGKAINGIVGDKFPELVNVFSWSFSSTQASVPGSRRKVRLGNGTEERQGMESSDDDVAVASECLSVDQVDAGEVDVQRVVSSFQVLAELIKTKTAKKWPKREKRENKDGKDLSDVEKLLVVLQRLPCSLFTSANLVRCIVGLLACDILAKKLACPGAQRLSVVLLCRQSLLTVLQICLPRRAFTAWPVIDVEMFLNWLHATPIKSNRAPEGLTSEVQSKLANVSDDLLRVVITGGLKSRNKTGLSAISLFSDNLLAHLYSSDEKMSECYARNLEAICVVVTPCVELLELKTAHKSSTRAAAGVVVKSAVSLINVIEPCLDETRGTGGDETIDKMKAEVPFLKLTGVITRGLSLVHDSKVPEAVDAEHRREDWSQVVVMAMTRVIAHLEHEAMSPGELVDAGTYVAILDDICHCNQEYRDVLPNEFVSRLLGISLEILRKCGSFSDEEIPGGGGYSGQRCYLRDAILGLLSTLLEANGGENCTSTLETVVEVSVAGEQESPLKLLVGLSVLKSLLSKKIVKKRRKDLRASFAKVLITLLQRATSDVKVLTLVLEVIAAVLTLGSGSLYPRDISLIFHALAIARDVDANDLRIFSRLFASRFSILSWTLFLYPDYVYGLIHVFLPCVSDLLSGLLAQGPNSSTGRGNSRDTAVLRECAQKMSRLYQELASHKDVLSKYSAYFLANCIHLLSTQGIPGAIRDTLTEGVHYLFDICKEDTLTRVHIYLPMTERELFKSLKEDFTKHHKFKGNA